MKIGRVGLKIESYDQIINRLIDFFIQNNGTINKYEFDKNESKTSILVDEETKQRLNQLGNKDNTYDDILSSLVDFYEQRKGGENDTE